VLVERILEGAAARSFDFLAIGAYVYMKIPERKGEELDIRGGEMPGLILRPKHDGFGWHAGMICEMLENWRANAKCREIALRESSKLEREDAAQAYAG
jgi:hypothetical protein